jgi:hypothetical protein
VFLLEDELITVKTFTIIFMLTHFNDVQTANCALHIDQANDERGVSLVCGFATTVVNPYGGRLFMLQLHSDCHSSGFVNVGR